MNMAPTVTDSLASCLTCPNALPEGSTRTQCETCHPTKPTIYAYRAFQPTALNTPFVLDRHPRTLTTFNGLSWQTAKQMRSNGWFGPCTDVHTGRSLMFRPSDCGGGCYCAAEWKLAPKRRARWVLQSTQALTMEK
jgi:hypothetical protein